MKITYFIDRPVFSAVISILIVIVGVIGLTMLPIDQYPQITPPVVKISASYPGASALTVSQAVATPIEQELNGTPGMLYMESTSSNSGGFSATITIVCRRDTKSCKTGGGAASGGSNTKRHLCRETSIQPVDDHLSDIYGSEI